MLWHPFVNESMEHVYQGWLKKSVVLRPNLVMIGSATVSDLIH